jgi:hypothetical protein
MGSVGDLQLSELIGVVVGQVPQLGTAAALLIPRVVAPGLDQIGELVEHVVSHGAGASIPS